MKQLTLGSLFDGIGGFCYAAGIPSGIDTGCLNLVTKIETSLLEDVVINEHYSCQKPIETIIYDENMELYQVGELMTIWELPQIHRDVRQYLE